MIARTWRGRTTKERAEDYRRHFTTAVAPNLQRIAGHKGAYLLQRETDGLVEFVAITFWDSIESVKQFSGDDPDVAHIEPEARAALTEFDEFACNYEIACSSVAD
jgi:heme-degrading monooxygenase HmoA